MRRRRLTRREKRSRTKKIVIMSSLCLLLVMTAGYAAFQTNLNITAKGNIKEKPNCEFGGIKVNVVDNGDGLYKDIYEEGKCTYKGADPNNYITFSGETWRIISIETDGTIKIMRSESIGTRAWDPRDSTTDRNNANNTYCQISSGTYYGCNAWAAVDGTFTNGSKSGTVTQNSTLNNFLNEEYLPTLSDSDKVVSHNFSIGAVTSDNNDLAEQIASENGTTWNGKVGLITASEYLRANTNTEQCGTLSLNNDNSSTCRKTDWMIKVINYWTISPSANSSNLVLFFISSGDVSGGNARNNSGVFPVLYLSSDITLTGDGSSDNPFIIK